MGATPMTKPIIAIACRASELAERLQESIDLAEAGELPTARGRLVRFHDLPNDEQLVSIHAQLARLLRDGPP